VQGDRVRLAIGRTIPSPSSTSAACKIANRIAGRDRAWGVRRRCRTAPTGLRRARRRSIVKAAILYINWLAPGFNIDSRSRQVQFYQSPNSQEPNFRAKAVESERELTSTPNNSYGTLAKTIKSINCSFLPPYNVYLTWLAMRLPY
jgi:hypothetical protein